VTVVTVVLVALAFAVTGLVVRRHLRFHLDCVGAAVFVLLLKYLMGPRWVVVAQL
jgi:hypothetical protein